LFHLIIENPLCDEKILVESRHLLKAMVNIKHRAMLSLIYACGLRRSEIINLRISSIDSGRKLVIVKEGKGSKDRVVPIPESMIELLRLYYKQYKPEKGYLKVRNPERNIRKQV